MLSFEKAAAPPATSTARARTTSGRLVRANVSKAFSISLAPNRLKLARSRRGSPRCRGKGVVEEERTVGGDKFTRLQSLENLMQPVLLQADPDRAPDQTLAVGREPHKNGAGALANHPCERNGRGTHGSAGVYQERREHSGTQLMLGIPDFRTDQEPSRVRIHRCPDVDDLAVKQQAGVSLDIDRHLLPQLEERKIRLGDVGEHPHGRYV